MTHDELLQHEKKILVGLVDFYLEKGYEAATYQDEARGGIYENKLANRLGYGITNG